MSNREIPRDGRAPVFIVACPVHGMRVALDGDGLLLGRCQGCMEECAQGVRDIVEGAAAARAWAGETLARYTTGDRGSVLGESATVARLGHGSRCNS